MLAKLDKIFLSDKYIVTFFLITAYLQELAPVYAKVAHVYMMPIILASFCVLYRYLRAPGFFHSRGTGLWTIYVLAFALSFVANGFIEPRQNLVYLALSLINAVAFFWVDGRRSGISVEEEMRSISGIALIILTVNSIISMTLYLSGFSKYFVDRNNGFWTFIGHQQFENRFVGLEGSPNPLGWLCFGAIACAVIYLSLTESSKKTRRIAVYVSILFNYICLGLTLSRGSLIAVASGCVAYLLFYTVVSRGNRSITKNVAIVLLGTVLTVAVILASIFIFADATSRISAGWTSDTTASQQKTDNASSADSGTSSDTAATSGDTQISSNRFTSTRDVSNGRILINIIGYKILKYNDQMIFGVSPGDGPGAWHRFMDEHSEEVASSKYEYVRTSPKIVADMHNLFTQSLFYLGVVGLIAVILLVCLLADAVIKMFRRPDIVKNKRFAAALIFLIFGYGFIAMFDNIVLFSMNIYDLLFVVSFGRFVFIEADGEERRSWICRIDDLVRKPLTRLEVRKR